MTLCAPSVKARHLANDFCLRPCDRVPGESFGTSVRRSEVRLSQAISKNKRKKNPPKSHCVRPLTYLLVTESSHLFFCCGRLTLDPPLCPAAPSPICFNTSTSTSSTSGSDKLFSRLCSPDKTHPASVETAPASIVFPPLTVSSCGAVSGSPWAPWKNSASSLSFPLLFFSPLPPLQSVFRSRTE